MLDSYILYSPNEDFGRPDKFNGTNISERVFEALFKGASTRFGLQNVTKCFENAFWKVCSAFQNLLLGSIHLLTKSGVGISRKCCFPHGLWVRQTHRHAVIMLSSSCELNRHIDMLSWCYHHLVTQVYAPSQTIWSGWTKDKSEFSTYFSMISGQIEYSPLKCAAKIRIFIFCSSLPNLPLPNEDFGRPNKNFRTRFRSTFQRFVAQIEYSPMWETTFPRNSHTGLGRPVYELNILVSMLASS